MCPLCVLLWKQDEMVGQWCFATSGASFTIRKTEEQLCFQLVNRAKLMPHAEWLMGTLTEANGKANAVVRLRPQANQILVNFGDSSGRWGDDLIAMKASSMCTSFQFQGWAISSYDNCDRHFIDSLAPQLHVSIW